MFSGSQARLSQLAELIAQGAPLVPGKPPEDLAVPVLNPKDLVPPGPGRSSELERASVASGPRSERAVVKAGDVLVTARGTQLRAAVVPDATATAIASANLLLVRLRGGLLPEVLAAYLTSTSAKRQLVSRARGTTGFVITSNALGALEIPVPNMDVQQRLVAFLRAGREAVYATERLLDLRRELVQTALDGVFESGELSVDGTDLR